MNETMKLFLEILKASLSGEPLDPDWEITSGEWQALLRMAGIHKVLPMFFETVHAAKSLGQAERLMIKRQVMQQVMMQTIRTEEFLALNRKLQEAGVRPLVVKGIICRNLYEKPDNRPSGDEDVLIPAEQAELCHQVMLDWGMHTTVEGSQRLTAYEIPYRKEGSPLFIELHKHLFPPESAAYGDLNRFFDGVFDRAIREEIQGSPVDTMGHTDHLFYLICHAFKHFLHSGFGIRQVCDIILYANAYGSLIDWGQMLENCRQIRAEKFAAALFKIGSDYLVFDPEKAAYPKAWRSIRVDEMPMLEDLLCAGVYGGADMSRRHSSNITLDAVAAQKQGRRAKHAVAASVFPSAARLEGRYPYLKKCPWLLPVAWISRLWEYFRETGRSKDNSAAEALKIGTERIGLMKVYGIIR